MQTRKQWQEDFKVLKSYIINSEAHYLELEQDKLAHLEYIYLSELEFINNNKNQLLSIFKKIPFNYISKYLNIILDIRTKGQSLEIQKDTKKNYQYYTKYYIEIMLYRMALNGNRNTINYKIFRFIYDTGFYILDNPIFIKFLEYTNNISNEEDLKKYIALEEIKINKIKQILKEQIQAVKET
ncbi:hypothetical protein [Candidatus Babela massiliensis]|nr:hypothetical protein [Candidatus Babela massiliensis]